MGSYCVQNQTCYGEEKRLYVSLVLKGQVLRTELHYLVNVKKRKIGYNNVKRLCMRLMECGSDR